MNGIITPPNLKDSILSRLRREPETATMKIQYHAVRATDTKTEQILVTREDGQMTEEHVRFHETDKAAIAAMREANEALWAVG